MTESVERPDLAAGEIELVNDEVLWRQIHPGWLDGSFVSTQAFTPTKKDEDKLSFARSPKVTAKDAYDEFVNDLQQISCGVVSSTVTAAQSTKLRVIDDFEAETRPTPCPTGHCYIDFRGAGGSSRRKRIATSLRDHALPRGWAYKPPTSA